MEFGTVLTVKRFNKEEGYYSDEDYVYLADISDNTYIGRILNEEKGRQVLVFSEKNQKLSSKQQFYVVVLSTKSFEERVVMLNNPIHDITTRQEDIREQLDIEDKIKIKQEILSGDFPEELVQYVSGLALN